MRRLSLQLITCPAAQGTYNHNTILGTGHLDANFLLSTLSSWEWRSRRLGKARLVGGHVPGWVWK